MPAAFQLYRKSQTFFGDDGQEIPGGSLAFFEAGTSTPAHVYAEKALSTDNGVTVTLDASSRPSVAIWGTGAFDVKVYNADAVLVGEDLQIEIPGGEATALPTLDPDKFLTNDGAVMSWADILQVPDPTGHADQVLSSDGTTLTWIAKPADGADGVSDTATTSTTARIGNILIQSGTATAPSDTSVRTSVNITFPTAYTKIWAVLPVVNTSSVSTGNGGAIPVGSVTGYTPGSAATGATINFRNPSDGDIIDSGDYISSSVPISWIAIGEIAGS